MHGSAYPILMREIAFVLLQRPTYQRTILKDENELCKQCEILIFNALALAYNEKRHSKGLRADNSIFLSRRTIYCDFFF